jgi:hypothetical protein
MKRIFLTISVFIVVAFSANAQTSGAKLPVAQKKIDSTKNSATLVIKPPVVTKELAMKNYVAGRWVGTFTGASGNTMYYSLQFNTDGSLQNLAADDYVNAKGTYTISGNTIEGNYKGPNLGIVFKGAIDMATNTISGTWLYNPGIAWTLKKR